MLRYRELGRCRRGAGGTGFRLPAPGRVFRRVSPPSRRRRGQREGRSGVQLPWSRTQREPSSGSSLRFNTGLRLCFSTSLEMISFPLPAAFVLNPSSSKPTRGKKKKYDFHLRLLPAFSARITHFYGNSELSRAQRSARGC